jgi:hypothetical protein
MVVLIMRKKGFIFFFTIFIGYLWSFDTGVFTDTDWISKVINTNSRGDWYEFTLTISLNEDIFKEITVEIMYELTGTNVIESQRKVGHKAYQRFLSRGFNSRVNTLNAWLIETEDPSGFTSRECSMITLVFKEDFSSFTGSGLAGSVGSFNAIRKEK